MNSIGNDENSDEKDLVKVSPLFLEIYEKEKKNIDRFKEMEETLPSSYFFPLTDGTDKLLVRECDMDDNDIIFIESKSDNDIEITDLGD